MQIFITLGQPLLGEKYVAEKKKERRIITKIVDTFFLSHANGQRTLGLDHYIGWPIYLADTNTDISGRYIGIGKLNIGIGHISIGIG